jgi:hypothetical protein
MPDVPKELLPPLDKEPSNFPLLLAVEPRLLINTIVGTLWILPINIIILYTIMIIEV